MQGHKDIIAGLNQIIAGELTAINQYFLHARICKDWGYEKIADKIYHESIDEMKHAQALIDRVLFLEGLPNVQKLNSIRIGQNIKEMFEGDLALEHDNIPNLRSLIGLCWEHKDHVTKDLLEKILISEEEHVDWLETQMKRIQDVGVENYLAQQMQV